MNSASPASLTRTRSSSSFATQSSSIPPTPHAQWLRSPSPTPPWSFVLRDLVGVAEGDLLTGDVDGITTLNLSGLNISLLDGLQHFTTLTTLSLTDNLIVDLSPLQGLANLKTVTLAANEVRDIEPLGDNPALANGSSVILVGNPLSILSRTTYVTTMQDRGATVTADAFAVTSPIHCWR